MPQVEEWRRVHQCKVDVYVPPHLYPLFNTSYPLLNFVFEIPEEIEPAMSAYVKDQASPQQTKGTYAYVFSIGCHQPNDMTTPVIQIATQRLGVAHQEIKPKISLPPNLKNNFDKKYVCIATQSTAQLKYWNNPDGWEQTVDYLKTLGYKVVCIDQHAQFGVDGHWNDTPANSIRKNQFHNDPEISLTDRINDLYFCDFFVGLSSGLSWLAWALGKPTVVISGFTSSGHEFYTPYRVINEDVCNSCFGDVDCMPFDKGDWMWCPRHKGTSRAFECSKEITFEMVKKQIDRLV